MGNDINEGILTLGEVLSVGKKGMGMPYHNGNIMGRAEDNSQRPVEASKPRPVQRGLYRRPIW
jgi:hypothetical protein